MCFYYSVGTDFFCFKIHFQLVSYLGLLSYSSMQVGIWQIFSGLMSLVTRRLTKCVMWFSILARILINFIMTGSNEPSGVEAFNIIGKTREARGAAIGGFEVGHLERDLVQGFLDGQRSMVSAMTEVVLNAEEGVSLDRLRELAGKFQSLRDSLASGNSDVVIDCVDFSMLQGQQPILFFTVYNRFQSEQCVSRHVTVACYLRNGIVCLREVVGSQVMKDEYSYRNPLVSVDEIVSLAKEVGFEDVRVLP